MPSRSSPSIVASLLCVLSIAAEAQGVRYAPGTTRYRISTSSVASQTTPLGSNSYELSIEQQYTVRLASQGRDTLVESLSIDSVKIASNTATPDLGALQGSTYVARVSPTGKVYSATPIASSGQLHAQLSEAVSRFLPVYRSGLVTGQTWADTTSGRAMQQGVEVDRTVIASYRVVGDTALRGEPALKVDRTTISRAAGSGVAAGSPVSLEAATRSDGSFYLSRSGVYLGGESDDDVTLKLTILGQGAEITVKQKARTHVEALP